MEWLLLAMVAAAFWLGRRRGMDEAHDEAEKAFQKMREHIETAKRHIDREPRDALIARVRAARDSNGSH